MRQLALIIGLLSILMVCGCVTKEATNSTQTPGELASKSVQVDGEGSSTDWYNKGNALSDQGKYDDAIIAFDKSIELDPNNKTNAPRAWNNKGTALMLQGNLDEAIKAFDKSIELDPNSKAPWINKYTIYDIEGKQYEAAQAIQQANAIQNT